MTGNQEAARAVGRCYGAIFLSFFGGVWLLLAADAFAHLHKAEVSLIAAATALVILTALRLKRRGTQAAKNAFPEEERRRSDRAFGILNALQWGMVLLVALLLPRLGYQDLVVPAIALIVGLHFFLMPRLYQHRANWVTGACLALWAVLCPLLFHGDRMIGQVALGAGLVLWTSAAWALKTASQFLRSAGL